MKRQNIEHRRGQSTTEYAVVLALVAVLAIAALVAGGSAVAGVFSSASDRVQAVVSGGVSGTAPTAMVTPSVQTVGQTVTVSGSGYTPDSPVTITLHSTPVVLGTTTSDSAGNVGPVSVTIPNGTDTTITHVITLSTSTQTGISNSLTVQAGLLPIALPLNTIQCDANDYLVTTSTPWPTNTQVTVPLCSGGPGNVSWLSWMPPAVGNSLLTQEISAPIDPSSVPVPSWPYVAATGDSIGGTALDSALQAYTGTIIQVPMFDSTCNAQPSNDTLSGCPAANVGGTGQQQWVHATTVEQFRLDAAYLDGGLSLCGMGNAATGCLIGEFVDASAGATPTPPAPTPTPAPPAPTPTP